VLLERFRRSGSAGNEAIEINAHSRVAIHAFGNPRGWGGLATIAAYPLGDPHDVDVRIVDDPDVRPEGLFDSAFGAGVDKTDLHGGRSSEMIASLLGYEKDEIQLVRRN
jgi:hypothetical protein